MGVHDATVGVEAYKILYTDICNGISKAINSLQADLCFVEMDVACEIFEVITEQIKKVLLCYLEEQKSTFKKVKSVC